MAVFVVEKEKQYIQTLRRQIKKISKWLEDNDDKPGKTGKSRKSNITDNDSAKMKTSHGVIQGYDGVATVDSKHQIVVQAEAYGQSQKRKRGRTCINGDFGAESSVARTEAF